MLAKRTPAEQHQFTGGGCGLKPGCGLGLFSEGGFALMKGVFQVPCAFKGRVPVVFKARHLAGDEQRRKHKRKGHDDLAFAYCHSPVSICRARRSARPPTCRAQREARMFAAAAA